MNDEILKEILKEVKEIKEIKEEINGIKEKIHEMDEKMEAMHKDIIKEYHDFTYSAEKIYNEKYNRLDNKVSKNEKDLEEYKNKIKQGVQLLNKAVG